MDDMTQTAIDRIAVYPGELLLATNPPAMQIPVMIFMYAVTVMAVLISCSIIDRYGSRHNGRGSYVWLIGGVIAAGMSVGSFVYLQDWTSDLAVRKAELEKSFAASENCKIVTRAIADGKIEDLDAPVERALFQSCGRWSVLLAVYYPTSKYVLSEKRWRPENLRLKNPIPTGALLN